MITADSLLRYHVSPHSFHPRIGRFAKKWLFVRCTALSPVGLRLILNQRASGTRTLLARTIC